ncbi:MAG TPA: hypothetical protein VLA14_10155, partial [Polyangia bacterium]|nr:hypothetical protein [Polyangia bacterium]
GSAADRLAEIAPYFGKTDREIRVLRARGLARTAVTAARALPATLSALRGRLKERAPVLFAQAREEWVDAKPVVVEKLRARFTPERAQRARPSNESRGFAAAAST